MTYVQGFVAAVPLANKERYVALSRQTWAVFRDLGALSTMEAWGDDVPDGTTTDFRRAVLAKPDETVVFSWIVWPDKATCASAAAAMMDDARMKAIDMPFDGKRLVYGGFTPIFEGARDGID